MARAGAIPKHNALYAFAGTTSNNTHFFGRDQIHSFIYDHHLWCSTRVKYTVISWEFMGKTIRDEGLHIIYCQMWFIDFLSNWWLMYTIFVIKFTCLNLTAITFCKASIFFWFMKPYTIIYLNHLAR